MSQAASLLARTFALVLFAFVFMTVPVESVAGDDDCAPTVADPDAEGKAVARIRPSSGKLKIRARELEAAREFRITVNGVQIGSMTTNSKGRGRARFSSKPGSKDQLLGVDPRGETVTVGDEEGEDVLECDISEDDEMEPDGIRCCLPHEDESECEHLTAAHCAAEGGVDVGPGSCFPDPCEDDPPSGDPVRCCFPHEDGAQCLELNAELCSHEDGISLGAGSCDPNPCPPPVDESVRCCLEHENEAICLKLSAEHCTAEGGASLGAGTCSPNPCEQPPPPPRCCLVIEGESVCEDLAPEHCAEEGGSAIGPGSCEPNPCGG
jgi:hypothetical protein